jgi:hypothetical protein
MEYISHFPLHLTPLLFTTATFLFYSHKKFRFPLFLETAEKIANTENKMQAKDTFHSVSFKGTC